MNFSITPLSEPDRNKLLNRLLAPEFISQELGQAGVWRGNSETLAGLPTSVSKEALTGLFLRSETHRDSPALELWRPKDQPVGWALEFRLDSMHNTVWAIGDEERRNQAELCHFVSVDKTLERLDALIRRVGGFPQAGKSGPVFALFQSGTGEGQTPQLTATVLLPNGHRQPDGGLVTFPGAAITQAKDHLHKSYLSEFVPRALYSFGRLGTSPATIPTKLFPPPAEDTLIGGTFLASRRIVFKSSDLHTQWRRQAEVRNFGSEALERVLGDARSLARIQGPGYEGHFPPNRIEALAERLWTALLARPKSPRPAIAPERDSNRPQV